MADSNKGDQSPNFSFCDDGGRPYIQQYSTTSKFRPRDRVYFRQAGTGAQEGPFIVESVPSSGRYTLLLTSGQKAKNGAEVEERELEEA
ncbi:hypothetical protein N431DRAFT_138387 [Stipitochalara longipes BDJ]|nr:hypothetical protein N431DRAFT_138387 [Stipitochalara longipes BDJ]